MAAGSHMLEFVWVILYHPGSEIVGPN